MLRVHAEQGQPQTGRRADTGAALTPSTHMRVRRVLPHRLDPILEHVVVGVLVQLARESEVVHVSRESLDLGCVSAADVKQMGCFRGVRVGLRRGMCHAEPCSGVA